jgi:hypothetical protein
MLLNSKPSCKNRDQSAEQWLQGCGFSDPWLMVEGRKQKETKKRKKITSSL